MFDASADAHPDEDTLVSFVRGFLEPMEESRRGFPSFDGTWIILAY